MQVEIELECFYCGEQMTPKEIQECYKSAKKDLERELDQIVEEQDRIKRKSKLEKEIEENFDISKFSFQELRCTICDCEIFHAMGLESGHELNKRIILKCIRCENLIGNDDLTF